MLISISISSASDVFGAADGAPVDGAGRALVVAAHGSAEPAVNESIHRLARRVGHRLRFDEAIAAFHQGEPRFSSALDALRSDEVVVVPLLQSEGYYCHRVLPAELARNRRFAALRLRQTRAVGVHPGLGEMLARRIHELCARYPLSSPVIALVGHGTPRHRGSRQAAEASGRDLERRTGLQTRAFFLDEEPGVDAIAGYGPKRDVIVVPLLIGAGRHATIDLATRLGIGTRARVPGGAASDAEISEDAEIGELVAAAGARRVLIDRPFGLDPAIEDIVVDLAGSAITTNRPSGER
jgi:sirohydrochlorin cobaltochelatase